ncbi:MAG TPA: TIGR03118 family protein [Candidatus Acidoferrum sp.]|nr:TIGR03118 family protein [Candidatus Acidoferrum sp.]
MLKSKFISSLVCLVFLGSALGAKIAVAQTVAYRQVNLSSSVQGAANNLVPGLRNPWGIGFLSGQPFFISENKGGHVTALDATGFGARPGDFAVPNAAGTGFDSPTGIVADQNSFFADRSVVNPFIVVTEEGGIFTWGPDANGNLPQQATLRRRIASEVYKGAAILNSPQAQPALAVTDFAHANIETFLPGFAGVALAGSFTDPTLPPGFAPFGIQVIGNQVFVTYGLQDAAKHDPIPGAGNGVVSIFDLNGNFVKRFATGGALNAPWGILKAGANFGPFSNDILIGNVGDGKINAFNPTTGQLLGTLVDGNGDAISQLGLHGLVFRPDGFGAPNTLYFTSQVSAETDGLFGALTPGLVSAMRISAPNGNINVNVTLTANVAAGPGNTGSPTGTVSFFDGSIQLKPVPVVNGTASLSTFFTIAGIHSITAQYSGDSTFLPRQETTSMQITGIATTSTLTAPADAAPGALIVLNATVSSAGGVPTGQVNFLDGTTNIGTAALNAEGNAFLRTDTLSAGTHSLTATYPGDGKFEASASAEVTTDIANPDFSIAAAPSTGSVIAGQSTQFVLTVTPARGFAGNVAFSCGPITGVTCSFDPATVTPAGGPVNTKLTVTISPNGAQSGQLMPDWMGPLGLLFAISLCGFATWRVRTLPSARLSAAGAMAAVVFTLALAIGGCGGYGNSTPANRRTATINVTATSGRISHSTTVTVTVQ